MTIRVAGSRLLLVLVSLASTACSAGDDDGFQAGMKITKEAKPADAGLPAYPNAEPYTEPGDSDSAAKFGLSTPFFGVKVVAMELQTQDSPEQVAKFYRSALAKYGDVLECRGREDKGKTLSGSDLKCDSDDWDPKEIVYKTGTEKNQRIVAIDPLDHGTKFALVHVQVREDKK